MTKEMLSFFGMTGIPFSKEIDTKNLLLLPSMEKSLTSLKFLASVRGIGLLTGKSGTGNYGK
jgi:type II secretory pathway predicted ATPase ExeA